MLTKSTYHESHITAKVHTYCTHVEVRMFLAVKQQLSYNDRIPLSLEMFTNSSTSSFTNDSPNAKPLLEVYLAERGV